MRNFLNQKVQTIKPSGIRKFFNLASEMEDVISLGVGEPDFDTPWHVRDEAIYTIQQGRTFYTANAGLIELRRAIANNIARLQGVHYKPETEVLVTIGGSEAIDLVFRAVIEPGDEVIFTEPCYVSYLPCIQLVDGIPVPISLKEENEFRLTRAELEAAITDKTKVLVLSFPNNPTGAVMSKADLEDIADLIIKHDLLVVTDEIYDRLTYNEDEEHVSIISLPGMRERTIYINGFSKTYAMTGWRIGYCAGPEELLQQMTKIHQFTIMAAPTMSQYAGLEAMTTGEDDVAEMRESYNQRRRYLLSEMSRLGIPCFEPLGAFYIFPNISQFGMSSEDFAMTLLHEERLAVVPGTAFGESGEGFIRISYAYSISELKTAIERIESFINKRKEV